MATVAPLHFFLKIHFFFFRKAFRFIQALQKELQLIGP